MMSDQMTEETPVETHADWALRKRREAMKVTRYQAKAALMQAGLLADAEAAVVAMDDPMIDLAWQEAGFERLSPMVERLGEEMGFTAEQLDDLFDQAAKIA